MKFLLIQLIYENYMSESQDLINKLLEQKSELTKEIIDQKIIEKKEKIGLISYPNSNLILFFANSDSFSSAIKKTEGHKPHLTKVPNIKLWKFP